MIEKRYLTIAETAKYIGINIETLRRGTSNFPEMVPPFIVVSGRETKHRIIRFDRLDVDAWMQSRKNRTLPEPQRNEITQDTAQASES